MRTRIFFVLALLLGACAFTASVFPVFWVPFGVLVGLGLLGVADVTQRRRAVLRNFPILGHFRYLLEAIRPEINQYFIESNTDGTPFNRELRSVVYQRAKGVLDTVPFGTQVDVYAEGYEWVSHSILARDLHGEPAPRVTIGGRHCSQPYDAALLNISAMSYGSLSSHAVLAMGNGARAAGCYQNTGEGGLSPYHLRTGADLVWQLGTGYFGCRTSEAGFDPQAFARQAARPQVRMIEVKLSQGAKPGHGGILPARKVTREIAEIRGVPLGADVHSPPAHSTFSTPRELCEWIGELRRLAGGKPVGIKLCVGERSEVLALGKAMRATGTCPDFITVDGGEGGTGAAPLEFANSVGMPLREGLVLVHNMLVGFGLRDEVRVIASGRVVTGFDLAVRLALGADLVCSARAMMMAVGCIQARRCNSNDCPVGVATQVPSLVQGLDVEDKSERVASFQRETVEGFMELLGAAGLSRPEELGPDRILRRTSPREVATLAEVYEFIEPQSLLVDPVPESLESAWLAASADSFVPARGSACRA
ncbi:MAG: FMN-binding glutamate synthase family protein [Planctomycetes bacterium]|nr:FMN-binding glutamate synthase family protein [Planctomycetota bacterium]